MAGNATVGGNAHAPSVCHHGSNSPFLGEAVALLIAVIGLHDRYDLTVEGKLYQALWRYIHDTLKRETAVELSNRRCGQYIRQASNRWLEALHQLFPRSGELLLREKAEAEKPLKDGKGKAEIALPVKLFLGHIVSAPPTGCLALHTSL